MLAYFKDTSAKFYVSRYQSALMPFLKPPLKPRRENARSWPSRGAAR